ncbi:MAG: hypothetical protein R3F56_11350 [Planctomycetota bacterium]
MRSPCLIAPLAALVLAACGSRRTVLVTPKSARPVEIEVEVYDPVTNYVWEGVSVRVVEGYHEWSGCTCQAGEPDLWLTTDETGRVLFTAEHLAAADIGFLENERGEAILEPDRESDEAFVLVELDAIGFDRAQFDVPLSWSEPSVFVSLPFSEPSSPGLHVRASIGGPRRVARRLER